MRLLFACSFISLVGALQLLDVGLGVEPTHHSCERWLVRRLFPMWAALHWRIQAWRCQVRRVNSLRVCRNHCFRILVRLEVLEARRTRQLTDGTEIEYSSGMTPSSSDDEANNAWVDLNALD